MKSIIYLTQDNKILTLGIGSDLFNCHELIAWLVREDAYEQVNICIVSTIDFLRIYLALNNKCVYYQKVFFYYFTLSEVICPKHSNH